MPVRFFVDEEDGFGFTVNREQAEQLLITLGMDLPVSSTPLMPFGASWGGTIEPLLAKKNLDALRREFLRNRIDEFTSAVMSQNDLVHCLIAVESLCDRAVLFSRQVQFWEKDST